MPTRQRYLEMAEELAVGAPDDVLIAALEEWNGTLRDNPKGWDKALSELRLLVHPRVRRRWNAIRLAAEADPQPRLLTKFLMLARRVRDGKTI